MIYFDNSATTKPSLACIDATIKAMTDDFANASSLHSAGVASHKWIDMCKSAVSKKLGCTAQEVLLTPGGTYSNNLAFNTAVTALKRRGNKIVISSVEHPSVEECAQKLEADGFEVVRCNPCDMTEFENAIDSKTILVSCMLVNNETGTIFDVSKLRSIITKKNSFALLHIDAVQAFGKIPVKVKKLGCDMLSISAHKINGPKGIGALYVSKSVRVSPVLFGGEQENSLVPGTYNTPAAAGFYAAVSELPENVDFSELYNAFVQKAKQYDFIKLNEFAAQCGYIINVTFDGYLGENVLHYLESFDIYVSQGSACSSHSKQKGRVLIALGKDKRAADGAIRISFDKNNTVEEINKFFEVVSTIPDKLIKLYK